MNRGAAPQHLNFLSAESFVIYLAFGELTLLPPPGATVVLQDRVPHSATSDLLVDNSFMTFTFNEPLPSPLSLG